MTRLLICSALAVIALPAHATPDRQVVVRDTAFAVSDTHLFVLRRTHDNLGLHMASQEEVRLVMIPIDGTASSAIRLHAQQVITEYDRVSDRHYRTVRSSPDFRALNPFSIVSNLGAGLLDPHITKQGSQVDLKTDTRVYLAQTMTSLARTKQPESKAGAGPGSAEAYSTLVENADRCVEQDENYLVALNSRTIQLVRVTCYAHFDEEAASLLMPRIVEAP